jgi:putative hydrolase of the HAD superfamily
MSGRVDAVVFDWGGTLTPWHEIDIADGWRAYARVYSPARVEELAAALLAAEDGIWARQRESAGAHGTGHLDQVFVAAGVDLDSPAHPPALESYLRAWDPHTLTDPGVPDLFRALRADGIRVGVLSNTLWPRWHHEAVFARDGVLDLIDGAVYTSETEVGKPHADAFLAALDAVGVTDPARVVFVGDRPWDDIHGAQQVGMRAVWVPHSVLPVGQQVDVDVTPDAVVEHIGEVLDLVRRWNAGA